MPINCWGWSWNPLADVTTAFRQRAKECTLMPATATAVQNRNSDGFWKRTNFSKNTSA